MQSLPTQQTTLSGTHTQPQQNCTQTRKQLYHNAVRDDVVAGTFVASAWRLPGQTWRWSWTTSLAYLSPTPRITKCGALLLVQPTSLLPRLVGLHMGLRLPRHHRRWVVETMNKHDRELKFTASVLGDDSKNYHAWSHRCDHTHNVCYSYSSGKHAAGRSLGCAVYDVQTMGPQAVQSVER